jgi:7,8-dihydropterin-6-yl-methyl-4-(beta-D-ribofuranosyl)aminobenzene 5'-phosphate synthase
MKRVQLPTVFLTVVCIFTSFNTPDPAKKMFLSNGLTLTILYDNYKYEDGFKSSWGFSCLIEGGGQTILFDTGGMDGNLMHNFKAAGKDPETVDLVVLSHIHLDHTGGISDFLESKTGIDVFIPQSFPEELKKDLLNRGANPVMVQGAIKISENVWSTGEMGDQIIEQSLIIQTMKGLIIITGCAHPGIEKIVKKATAMKEEKVLLVMGGFHLLETDSEAVEVIARLFRDQDIQYVAPTHCSGDGTIRIFKEVFGDHCIRLGTGKVLETAGL